MSEFPDPPKGHAWEVRTSLPNWSVHVRLVRTGWRRWLMGDGPVESSSVWAHQREGVMEMDEAHRREAMLARGLLWKFYSRRGKLPYGT